MEFRELPPVKEQLMKCVRCGKCRELCPVFAEIGIESAAPRGMCLWFRCFVTAEVEAQPGGRKAGAMPDV